MFHRIYMYFCVHFNIRHKFIQLSTAFINIISVNLCLHHHLQFYTKKKLAIVNHCWFSLRNALKRTQKLAVEKLKTLFECVAKSQQYLYSVWLTLCPSNSSQKFTIHHPPPLFAHFISLLALLACSMVLLIYLKTWTIFFM